MTTRHTVSRSELHRLVWSEPLTKLAQQFGLSDVGLRKICLRHDIPLPPQGYRQQVAAGRAPKPAPLPKSKDDPTIEFTVTPEPPAFAMDLMDRIFAPLIEAEARPEARIEVATGTSLTHPIAKRIFKALKAARPDKYGAVVYEGPDPFRVRVPPGSIERAVNLIDAFAIALDQRRIEIRSGGSGPGGVGVIIGGEAERLAIEEASQRQIHWATEADKARTKRFGYSTAPMYDFVPSGVMTVQITTATYRDGLRSLWKDGKTRKVEDCLNEIMVGLYRAAHAATVQARKAEIRELRAGEENARRAALRLERATSRKQLDDLEEQSLAWERAQRMRGFILAYEAAGREPDGALPAEAVQWIDQASRHADRIDPLTPTPPSALDYDECDLTPISPWHIQDD